MHKIHYRVRFRICKRYRSWQRDESGQREMDEGLERRCILIRAAPGGRENNSTNNSYYSKHFNYWQLDGCWSGLLYLVRNASKYREIFKHVVLFSAHMRLAGESSPETQLIAYIIMWTANACRNGKCSSVSPAEFRLRNCFDEFIGITEAPHASRNAYTEMHFRKADEMEYAQRLRIAGISQCSAAKLIMHVWISMKFIYRNMLLIRLIWMLHSFINGKNILTFARQCDMDLLEYNGVNSVRLPATRLHFRRMRAEHMMSSSSPRLIAVQLASGTEQN